MDYDDYPLELGPRVRRLLLGAALLALVLLAGVVALRLHGISRLEELRRDVAVVGPADPEAWAPTVAPPESNAVRRMVAVAEDLEPADDTLRGLSSRRPEEWTAEEWAAVRRRLAAQADTLVELHRAARLPGGGLGLDYGAGGSDESGMGTPFGNVLGAIDLLRTDAVEAARSGDRERTLAGVATLSRLGALLAAEPQPIAQAVSQVATTAALLASRETLALPGAPAGYPERLRAALGPAPPATGPCRALAWQTLRLAGPGAAQRVRRMTDGRRWAVASRVAGEWLMAEALRSRPALATGCGRPWAPLMAAADAARSRWRLGPLESFDAEARGLLLRAAAVHAAQRLADLALELAAGGAAGAPYPASLAGARRGIDPLTGTRPDYGRRLDGSAWLALEAAEEKSHSRSGLRSVPYFWVLPPPAGTSPSVP
jgi:hypothetical protein